MGYSNGQLESEVKGGKGEKGDPGLPGIGFKLTDDGDFDIDNKRLTDLADPIDTSDAATKSYVDNHLGSGPASDVSKAYVDSENKRQDIAINDKASKSDLDDKLSIDGSNQMNANLIINNFKVTNLSPGIDSTDAVNKAQLDSLTSTSQTNYHLRPSFKFYKDFGDFVELSSSNPPNNFPSSHVNHIGGLIIEKESYNNGFGGQAWSSLKMIGSSGGFRTNETLIQVVGEDSHFQMITFSHQRVSGQYTKAFIQFTSDGQPGEITFQMRYYGTGFNQNIKFFFYSRVIAGREDVHFNHAIFDLTESSDNQNILYFENIGMNRNRISGLDSPRKDSEAANKKYVDRENSRQDIVIADKASTDYVNSEIAKIPKKTHFL